MNEWVDAILFGVALIAFTLGLSSVIMGAMADNAKGNIMQERIEYGFFGVSGLVVCFLMGYALA